MPLKNAKNVIFLLILTHLICFGRKMRRGKKKKMPPAPPPLILFSLGPILNVLSVFKIVYTHQSQLLLPLMRMNNFESLFIQNDRL